MIQRQGSIRDSVIQRWSYQCGLLAKALDQGLTGQASQAREAINGLVAIAETCKVYHLPNPPESIAHDPVFVGLEEFMQSDETVDQDEYWPPEQGRAQVAGNSRVVTPVTGIPKNLLQNSRLITGNEGRNTIMALGKKTAAAVAEPVLQPVAVTAKPAVKTTATGKKAQPVAIAPQTLAPVAPQVPAKPLSKAEQLAAMKKHRAVQAAQKQSGQAVAEEGGAGTGATMPKATRTKKAKVLTLCLDGCGAQVAGRFAPGHDAKLKSLLIKMERGEVDVQDCPAEAAPFVTFEGPIQTKEEALVPDGKGGTVKQTIVVNNYQLTRAPVRFPGRDDVEYVEDIGNGK